MTSLHRPSRTAFLALAALLLALPGRADDLEPALVGDDEIHLSEAALKVNDNNPITARRRALRANLNNLIDLIPGSLDTLIKDMPAVEKEKLGAEGQAALKKNFADKRAEALKMRETVSKKMLKDALEPLEKRYPSMRDELLSCVYQATAYRFFYDKDRFKFYAQKQMDINVALREREKDPRLTAKKREVLSKWDKELGGYPDVERLNMIYDMLDARQVDDQQLIITSGVERYSTSAAAVLGVKIAEFKPKPKPGAPSAVVQASLRAAPTAADAVPVSYSPEMDGVASSPSLFGRAVDSVVDGWHRAKAGVSGYSQKVADGIISWSRRNGLDEKLTGALVWTESSFSATVGSWANCVGLGQLSEGAARAYGVKNRQDIDQNLKGTTGFLADLMQRFATPDERRYTEGLYASAAIKIQKAVEGGADKKKTVDATFESLWPKIPAGMKNAVAAYNAGAGAITKYGGYDNLPLPRDGCVKRPAQDNSYCQTKGHVRSVYRKYLSLYVDTIPEGMVVDGPPSPTVLASYQPVL